MSRIAFLSDIHSNLQALDAVLDATTEQGCGAIYCLGDLVGYGARPVEVLDRLGEVGAHCLMGNHDALVAGLETGMGYNEVSQIAAAANRRLLSDEHLRFLAELPGTIDFDETTLLCHGSPTSYKQYTYNEIDFSLSVDDMKKNGLELCFLGHTHHPVLYDGERLRYRVDKALPLPKGKRRIINPGSVGQPRDRDPRASFAVWDRDAGTIRFHRVEYDVMAARQDVQRAGLPARLGDRLLEGR